MTATTSGGSGGTGVGASQQPIPPALRVDEAVRSQALRLTQIIDVIPQLICVVSAAGRVEYCNAPWRELFYADEGSPAEEVIPGKQHPEDRDRWRGVWREAHRQDAEYSLEVRIERTPQGTYSWYTERGSPLRDQEGVVSRWLVHLTLDDERRRSEDTLRSLLRNKDEFFAVLLHELRNPLAPIANALEILGRNSGDAEVVLRSRDLIHRQLQQLTRLVDDLLDVSRIERGTVDLKFARIDVADVVAEAVETARPLIESRGHQLAARIPACEYVVNADAIRLGQVITNLLINAAKYTNPGGYISVLVERTEIDVLLHVRDNGTGIAREQLEAVFDMFAQGTSTPASRMGGLGIGLSLGRKLVRLHGGSIVARSDGPGCGSEFTVTLPRADRVAHPAQ